MRTTTGILASLAFLLAVIPALSKHGEGETGTDNNNSKSSTTSEYPSSATASPSPSPSKSPIQLQFLQPDNSTTCASLTFRWQVPAALTNIVLALTVTNDRPTHPDQGPVSNVLVARTLATTIPASACAFIWPAVDVPQGTYVAVAVAPSPSVSATSATARLSATSPPFVVSAGPDTSCLVPAPSVTADSRSSGGPGSDSDSGSGSDSESDSDSGSQSQSPGGGGSGSPTGAVQESDVDGPKRLSPAVLGGVVAGVVVGVVILVCVFAFPHCWRRRLERKARSRRPGGPYYLF